MDIIIILVMVRVSRVNTYDKLTKLYALNTHSLLAANDTSIKLVLLTIRMGT